MFNHIYATVQTIQQKKDPAVLQGNVNRALNVQKLQERWVCAVRQPGTCIGAYCYVLPDTAVHLPLNHERLECWASAMVFLFRCYYSLHSTDIPLQLKKDDSATIDKPPTGNHRLFDPEAVPRSPVLQRRLASGAQNTGGGPAPAPVFNITVGDGLVDLFRPARAPVLDAPAVPAAPAPQTPAGPSSTNKMLLSPTCNIGRDMPISEFCNSFGLHPSVLEKLEENAYDFARNLRFITLDNLTEMGFKLGQRAALQDAVERWSVPRVV